MKARGYDGACEELAVHFLGVGPEADVQALAQHIQDAVEEWFAAKDDVNWWWRVSDTPPLKTDKEKDG